MLTVPQLIESWQEDYRKTLGALSSQGMLRAVEQGWSVNKLPLGYQVARATEKRVVIDQATAPLIAAAYVLAAEGHPLNEIRARLQRLGLAGRHGKPLSSPTLHLILCNPFYTGRLRYKGQLYPGKHHPLVSIDLFDRVQTALAERKPKKNTAKPDTSVAFNFSTPVSRCHRVLDKLPLSSARRLDSNGVDLYDVGHNIHNNRQ